MVLDDILRFPTAMRRDPEVDRWLDAQRPDLGAIAAEAFALMRECGDDVRELVHDGHPTACVGDAAFAYVDVFTRHVNVGFFFGAQLADRRALLEGTGKRGRHVKLGPGRQLRVDALAGLIEAAYLDMQARLPPR